MYTSYIQLNVLMKRKRLRTKVSIFVNCSGVVVIAVVNHRAVTTLHQTFYTLMMVSVASHNGHQCKPPTRRSIDTARIVADDVCGEKLHPWRSWRTLTVINC